MAMMKMLKEENIRLTGGIITGITNRIIADGRMIVCKCLIEDGREIKQGQEES